MWKRGERENKKRRRGEIKKKKNNIINHKKLSLIINSQNYLIKKNLVTKFCYY